jgi:copper oxidase (laccase) domain-containing protein
MKPKHSGDFRVTLHAQSSDLPAIVRLRQLLKIALRSYGFRCVALEQIHDVPVVDWTDATERLTEVFEETVCR